MKVKINESLICIPPYLSTTWDQVSSVQSEPHPETGEIVLVLHLVEGKVVRIPGLDSTLIEVVFNAHSKYVEQKGEKTEAKTPLGFLQNMLGLTPEQIASMPIRFGIQALPEGMENIETAMQHNPQAADTPDIPPEALAKIAEIAHMVTGGELASFPKPEPHCNCTHCQLARAIHKMPKEEEGEEVSEEDLKFKEWDIKQTGDKLYTVTNPLDPQEQYNVYLGSPVGCTCGKEKCEHIRIVLSN